MFRISSLFRIILLVAMMPISMVVSAQGQEECQYDQLNVDISATESTCQRNGSLTFHLRGAHVQNYQNFTYEVRSMVLGGVNIPETAGEVSADGEGRTIANLPSGLYRVIVRATCIADPTYTLQDFILENVQVPGNYMVPNVYFDAAKSRGAYTGCPTGKIVLDVTGGRGNFTFKVVKSPGDAHNGDVTPVKTGTSYALPYEQYPAGEYSIEIHDVDCDYTAVTNFQLTEYTANDLPRLQNETYSAFYPIISPNPDCHAITIQTNVHENFHKNRPSIIAAINSGAYEIGLSKPDEEPTSWIPATIYGGYKRASLGTHKLQEFYNDNSLKVTIRLKDCPTIKRSFLSYLRHPFTSDITNHCGYSVISPRPWTDYDGHYCFPLTVSVYPNEAAYNANPNSPLETKVLQKHADRVPTTVQGGESRFFVIKDADNNILQKQTLSAPYLEFYREWTYQRLSCDGFYAWFGYRGAVCTGVKYSVWNVEDPAHPVLLCENQTPGQNVACLLPYETNLRAILTAPKPDGTEISITHDFREPRPDFNVTLSYNYIDYCLVNVARFRMSTSPNRYLPPGTRMRITGPNGFIQEHTLTSYAYYWDFPSARLDPGQYTLDVWLGDCYHKTATLNMTTILDVKTFSVSSERDCAQMKVKPAGMVIFQNQERPGATYFRIASGPEGGYDPSARLSQTQVNNGGYFSLTKPGTYMVGISYENNCVFQQMPVEFERTNLRIDNLRTIAFACQNNSDDGHIYVKATEGYGTYTYVLYDAANEQLEDDHPVVDNDRVYFHYGKQGEYYTVRIQDECGNRFSQEINILDLSKQTIGSAVRGTVCVGDVIEFTSLPVGTYTWEKETAPGSNVYTFFSDEQNPTIPDAKPSHSGRYRVTVEATGCTGTSVGYVNINVVPCYAPVNPSLMNKYGNF